MDYLDIAQNKIDAYFREHKIPDYFYQCFFGEFVKVFGTNILIPDKTYLSEYDDDGNIINSNEDSYSYKDQIEYYLVVFGGTAGWNIAFKESCKQCGLLDIYKDYSNLDWVESDMFDGYIAEKTLNIIFSNDVENSYYKFILAKENNYDY